jgi:tRNA threonylcarbamoyladenosine biosynthesis protein TsaE
MVCWTRRIDLPDETATAALAHRLAPVLARGDVLLLSGGIGAGKTTFARALIRALLDDPGAEVPSPSFTLVQTYDTPELTIWHVDLYRLSGPDAVLELGLDGAMDDALCLIEWPDRMGDLAPAGALRLDFAAHADGHAMTMTAPAPWTPRLEPLFAAA